MLCLASLADVEELGLKQELIHLAKCHKDLAKSSVGLTGTETVTAKRMKRLIQMKTCAFVKETAPVAWAVF